MNSLKSQAMPILHMLWRQKWLAVGIAWLVCTVGWIGVAFIPTKYESSSRVYLNADPLLTPLLRGLAADTDPTRHLDFLQRTLLSRPNLEQLVRLTDLDAGLTTPEQKDALYQRLADGVEIRPITTEPDDHLLPRQRSAGGQERGSIAADDLCREDGGQQPQRDGQCAALSRRGDRILSRSIARR